ncbi:MAG: C10 family peptidase [Bacteroidales bacterium]|nr:C10 family peptidase [Candidatus Colimorpha merdihippi]MCQ2281262.1 C10 family peptidase [Bacteroidales bacterium]
MKKSLAIITLLISATMAIAGPVTSKEASRIAANFWLANTNQEAQSINLVEQTGLSTMYIFTINDEDGFIIVSAEDQAFPILAYSTTNAGGDLGPETRFWLNQYDAEIAAISAGQVEIDPSTADYISNQWNLLRTGNWSLPKTSSSVSPLMSTTWNQSPLYNNLCPANCPVGCVATAVVQVMKYWAQPIQGYGSHSYISRYGTLSADFGNTTYDWANMPNALGYSSTSTQINAVATLSYHFAVACNMDFAPSGSGAQVVGYAPSAEAALKTYFDYSNSLHGVYRSSYSDNDWVQMLVEEIDAARPVIYAGYDASAGHAFVFDGYNTLHQFHVNWGWGGSYNGYYSMGALNPGGGGTGTNSSNTFNQSNQALLGVQPNSLSVPHAPEEVILSSDSQDKEISFLSFSSPQSWIATTDANWFTISPSTGSGNASSTVITITAQTNNTNAPRQGTITILHSHDTAYVTVYQHACSSSDMCNLIVNMYDSQGDSWEGAYLTFANTNGVPFGTSTIRRGSYLIDTIPVCSDTIIATWHKGDNDSECRFFVHNTDNRMWINRSEPGSFIEGEQFIIVNPCANEGGEDANTYTYVIMPNDSTYGYIDGVDSNVAFGTKLDLTAIPTPNHRFVKWSDGSYENPRTITVLGNKRITANFATLGDDTLHYDAGQYVASHNYGAGFVWGIRLTPEELISHPGINGAQFYSLKSDTYTINIYQGDDTPDTLIYSTTKTVNRRETNKWIIASFGQTINVTPGKSLWLTIKCNTYSANNAPAALSSWCGTENGAWISGTNGSTWNTLSQLSTPIHGTWMLRAIMPKDNTKYIVSATPNRGSYGTVAGGGEYLFGSLAVLTATPKEGYRFDHWSDNTTDNPYNIWVVENTRKYAYFVEDNDNPAGISTIDDDNNTITYIQQRNLHIVNADGRQVQVFDMMGRTIFSSNHYDSTPILMPASGVYVVAIDQQYASKVVAY